MSKPIEIEWRAARDLARDAEHLPQADIQAVGDHHEARGDHLVIGEDDLLPVVAGRNRHGLGEDLLDASREFRGGSR